MGLITGLELIESGPPDEPFEALVREKLTSALQKRGIKGMLVCGARVGRATRECDLIALLETGVATIECKNATGRITGGINGLQIASQSEGNPCEQVLEQVNGLKESIASTLQPEQEVFVHGILVFPNSADLSELSGASGLRVNCHAGERSTGVIVCNLSHLEEVLVQLGDALTASFVAMAKATIFNCLSTAEERELVSREPVAFGRQGELVWSQQALRQTNWMYEEEPSQQDEPTGEIPADSGSAEMPQPEPSDPGTENASDADFERISESDAAVVEGAQQERLLSYLRWSGLAFVVGAGLWVALTGAPRSASATRRPLTTGESLAERTADMVSALDAGGAVETQTLTPRFADELVNEYALGLRSLWVPERGVQPISQKLSSGRPDRIGVEVEMGDGSDTTTVLKAVWERSGRQWLLDRWQVSTPKGLLRGAKAELPGAKLKCRRDNQLRIREEGLLQLHELPAFSGQNRLAAKTLQNLYTVLAREQRDREAPKIFYSTQLQVLMGKNRQVMSGLPVSKTAQVHLGSPLWPGKPVYWFTVQKPRSSKVAMGVVAFGVESGQVVIEDLRMRCPNS
ncbi:nuclease-related domain-containing protein [Gloeobacter kilaueensis]|uniref:NERD domain-containing protein n=1 Tax=Gloeobacter kilaueensis (strain ATCC BAA-2537 / CCAP 1431/1 / ULC 316 / JS1) TaxID=1183438 RepID=U5QJY0_GLOK1|nr:nuclease-related domain-containing protein [Gloeobacter kilaueensis]AGY57965.1 hypothetical protein GKIL_1719 [Gloeobacter kilaueensis JS1]